MQVHVAWPPAPDEHVACTLQEAQEAQDTPLPTYPLLHLQLLGESQLAWGSHATVPQLSRQHWESQSPLGLQPLSFLHGLPQPTLPLGHAKQKLALELELELEK